MRRCWALSAWFFCAVLASCNGASNGRCEKSLAEVGGWCPPTFDGTAAQLPPCMGYLTAVRICESLIVLSRDGGFTGGRCTYDGFTHALVGADAFSDLASFCDNSSFDVRAGRLPNDTCRSAAPIVQTTCSSEDGGS